MGRARETPRPGDYLARDLLGESIIVRGKDGDLAIGGATSCSIGSIAIARPILTMANPPTSFLV